MCAVRAVAAAPEYRSGSVAGAKIRKSGLCSLVLSSTATKRAWVLNLRVRISPLMVPSSMRLKLPMLAIVAHSWCRAAPFAADGDRPAAGRRRRAWKGAAQRSTRAAGRGAPGCTQRQRRKLGDTGRLGRAGGGGLVPVPLPGSCLKAAEGLARSPEG